MNSGVKNFIYMADNFLKKILQQKRGIGKVDLKSHKTQSTPLKLCKLLANLWFTNSDCSTVVEHMPCDPEVVDSNTTVRGTFILLLSFLSFVSRVYNSGTPKSCDSASDVKRYHKNELSSAA